MIDSILDGTLNSSRVILEEKMSRTKDSTYMVELQHPNGHVSYFRAGTGMNRNKVERFILKQGYTKVTGANVFSKEVRGDGVKTASIYLMDDLSKLD